MKKLIADKSGGVVLIRSLTFFLIIIFKSYSLLASTENLNSQCSVVLNSSSAVKHRNATVKRSFKYSQIARDHGVRFFLMKLSPQIFTDMVASSEPSSQISIPVTSGYDPVLNKAYDHSLLPIFTRDVGKFAHQMIRNGNDSIGNGVRTVRPQEWRIGLLFPVEVLDSIELSISHTMTVEARLYGSESVDVHSLSSGEFKNFMEKTELGTEAYRSGRDPEMNIDFSSLKGEELLVSEASLIWIPSPILDIIVAGRSRFLGEDHPLLPKRGEVFKARISEQDTTQPRGWRDLFPEKTNSLELVDGSLNLASWFHEVPDWDVVQSFLETQDSKGVDLDIFRKANIFFYLFFSFNFC